MSANPSITADLPTSNFGLFTRFPPGRTGCIYCQPGRSDPLVLRVLWRAAMPFSVLRYLPETFIPRRRFSIIAAVVVSLLVLLIPAIVYGLIAESLIEAIATAKENMNAVMSALVALALIAVPSYLISKDPASYNVPTQIMFKVFLFGASTWLGISLSNKRARRDATAKWLPAAETACKQLLTLSSTVERMKRTQTQACDAIDPLISQADQKALKTVISLQCRETGEKLATLRDHIENSISHWQVFIGTNCEGEECARIEGRLRECRQQLASSVEADRCAGASPVQGQKPQQAAAPNAGSAVATPTSVS